MLCELSAEGLTLAKHSFNECLRSHLFGAQYIHTNQWKKAVAEPNADAGAEAANELSLHYLSRTQCLCLLFLPGLALLC